MRRAVPALRTIWFFWREDCTREGYLTNLLIDSAGRLPSAEVLSLTANAVQKAPNQKNAMIRMLKRHLEGKKGRFKHLTPSDFGTVTNLMNDGSLYVTQFTNIDLQQGDLRELGAMSESSLSDEEIPVIENVGHDMDDDDAAEDEQPLQDYGEDPAEPQDDVGSETADADQAEATGTASLHESSPALLSSWEEGSTVIDVYFSSVEQLSNDKRMFLQQNASEPKSKGLRDPTREVAAASVSEQPTSTEKEQAVPGSFDDLVSKSLTPRGVQKQVRSEASQNQWSTDYMGFPPRQLQTSELHNPDPLAVGDSTEAGGKSAPYHPATPAGYDGNPESPAPSIETIPRTHVRVDIFVQDRYLRLNSFYPSTSSHLSVSEQLFTYMNSVFEKEGGNFDCLELSIITSYFQLAPCELWRHHRDADIKLQEFVKLHYCYAEHQEGRGRVLEIKVKPKRISWGFRGA